jgi:SAM-dependent methyltransferase
MTPLDTYIEYGALRLPPLELRWGGPRYRDDQRYVHSAQQNVRTLSQLCGLSQESRVLDVGCGPGRLLTGMLATYGSVTRYAGVDVHRGVIDWASTYVAPYVANVEFHWLDVANERYNRRGAALAVADAILPLADCSFDVVVLISVFSHMRLPDISVYLAEIRRVLASDGKVYLSLFVEYGVPDEEENPPDYHRLWSGPLHCVRLNRHAFEDRVHEAGLAVDRFTYRHTNDGQSTYVLSRTDQPAFRAKANVM